MKHYGSESDKRSISYSNLKVISVFNKGRLRRVSRNVSERAPTKKYKDGAGIDRFGGTAFLRATQPGPKACSQG